MEIRINLLGDLGEALRRSMSDEGYDVAPIEDDDHKTLVVWNKVRRYDIEPQPRQVSRAAENCTTGVMPDGHGMDGDVDFLHEALQVLVEGIMDAEVSAQIGAQRGARG